MKKLTIFLINRGTKTEETTEIPTMTDAGLPVDFISDEYRDDVDRQSILSFIMEVIADGFYCLGLRDIL